MPVFIDGTAIEVDGHLFEGAGKGYNGEPQLWLHNVFLGGLWASGLLHPGGVDVAKGWQTQLADDVTPVATGGYAGLATGRQRLLSWRPGPVLY